MKCECARVFLLLTIATLVLSLPVWAQEATKGEIRGTVKDEIGGVLPGVTVTATHTQTGETRTTVTTESGSYRLPALTLGAQVITAELSGFATMRREGVTLGLGQVLVVDFSLQVGALSESITVTGDAPLIDTTRADVSGQLEPKQIVNLPLMGRNWMELGFLMPGVTSTVVHPRGVASGRGDSWSQNVIIDGVDSREECCNRSNGTHTQEAIAEFKIITNNPTAEYGRTTSSVLTAVTKSGANAIHGSAFYLLRDESLDRPDFFTGQAEPLKYYQTGGSIGGPLRKDHAFFFGAIERQFDERTGFSSTGYPELDNFKVPLRAWQNYALARGDLHFRGTQNLSAKYYYWKQDDLNGSVVSSRGVEGRNTPWSTTDRIMNNYGLAVNHTWAGQDKLNEFTFGWVYLDWYWTGKHGIPTPDGWRDLGRDIPLLTTPSFLMGHATTVPQDPAFEKKVQFKDNFTRYMRWHGEHDLKVGVDTIFGWMDIGWFTNSRGSLTFVGDPVKPFDFNGYPEPTRFQLNLGRPGASCPDNLSDRAQQEVDRAKSCAWYLPVHNFVFAGFIQDNWRPIPRLNLNLGLRYEIEMGSLEPDYIEKYDPQLNPQIPHPTKSDSNNFGPRLGFTYDLTGKGETLVRAGGGVYYGSHNFNRVFNKLIADGWNTIVVDQPFPTRQPCFQGHTLQEAITENPSLLLPGCGSLTFDELYGRATKAIAAIAPGVQVDRAIQSSIGVTHQLSSDLAIEVDFVYNTTGPDRVRTDSNLFYDEATGGPRNPSIFGRPDPRFTAITTQFDWGKSIYKALQVSVNKRLRQNYQFQVNYSLTDSRDNISAGSGASGPDNPFDKGEWGPSDGSSRHRITANGVYTGLPLGFELGGVFRAYSGTYYDNLARGDFWNLGRATSRRFRQPDGTVVILGRNSNKGELFAKLDLRLSKRFGLGADRDVKLIAEIFNVLDRRNYGSYGTTMGTSTYQQPVRNPNNQFSPRQIQLGARVTF